MVEQKIWGTSELVYISKSTTVYLLRVKRGGVSSWHYHIGKNNAFHVVSGAFYIRVKKGSNYNPIYLTAGQDVVVYAGMENCHEFEADEDSVVIETCFNSQGDVDPNDIHRIRLGYYRRPDGTREDATEDRTCEICPMYDCVLQKCTITYESVSATDAICETSPLRRAVCTSVPPPELPRRKK